MKTLFSGIHEVAEYAALREKHSVSMNPNEEYEHAWKQQAIMLK